MTTRTLLVELGTEELPPKALRKLAVAFKDNFAAQLKNAGINYSDLKWYATPRRLALKAFNIDEKQPDKVIEKKGPAVNAAYANGEP